MLARLSAPDVAAFRKQLLEEVTREKAQRVLKHLRQALNFAVGPRLSEREPRSSDGEDRGRQARAEKGANTFPSGDGDVADGDGA